MTFHEDTVNLDRKDWNAVPTKDGSTVTIDTGYAKFTIDIPLKDLAVLVQDSLQLKDMEQAKELKAQRELGNEVRYYGR